MATGRKFGWHSGKLTCKDLDVLNSINLGTLDFGAAELDTVVFKGRLSTSTVAGAALSLGANYTYGEAAEFRWDVSSWSGIGNSFNGLYVRSSTSSANASGGLQGAQIMGVFNVTTGTTGFSNLKALYTECLVKANTSGNKTITNLTSVEANVSIENYGSTTLTFTNNIYCLYAKAQTGTGIADYTKINGIKIAGRDDGTARIFGNALDISDPEATVCTWTKGINITTSCTTGIVLATGTFTTGINLGGTLTTGLTIGTATTGFAITGVTTTGINITGNATDALKIQTGTFTDAIEIAGTTTNSINISSVGTTSSIGLLVVNGFLGKAIRVGTLSSTTPGSGAILDATTTRIVEVNADDNNTARATGTQGRAIFGRTMIYADNACEDWGIHGLSKISAVAKTGNVSAGICGAFESTGTCSTATGSGNTYVAGLMGRVGTEGSFTIGAGTYAACVLAFGNNQNANAFTNTGYHGFHVALTDVGTPEVFDVGLFIEDSSSTTGINIGACTTGINFAGASTTGISFTAGATTMLNANATAAAGSTRGIFIGEDSDSAQSGIPLLGANWATSQGNALYCDDDGVALVGYTEALTVRMLTTVAVASGDVSTAAIHPDLTLNANYTGIGGLSSIWGNTTIKTGVTINLNGSLGDVGGGTFGIDVVGTLAANSHGCGVSVGIGGSGINSGIICGYRIRAATGTVDWNGILSIEDGDGSWTSMTATAATDACTIGNGPSGTAGDPNYWLKIYIAETAYVFPVWSI